MSTSTSSEIISTIDDLQAKEVAPAIICIVLAGILGDRHAGANLGASTVALARAILHNKHVNDADTVAFVRRILAANVSEAA